jgi:hypothetical protein
VRCFCLKNKETAILEFKKKVDEAKNDRLMLWYADYYFLFVILVFIIYYLFIYSDWPQLFPVSVLLVRYSTLISLRKEIENLMPDLRGLVFSLTENNIMIDQLSSTNDLSFIEAVFDVQAKANDCAKVCLLSIFF